MKPRCKPPIHHTKTDFPVLVDVLQCTSFLAQSDHLRKFGERFGAQKMTISRFSSKKRPVWTAQMPVLD